MALRKTWLVLAVLFAVALPITVSIATHRGDNGLVPFQYLAADAFYYLTVAKQTVTVPTYDGVHATNGFHPLWQAVLIGAYRLFDLSDPEVQIWFAFLASGALLAAGLALLALSIAELTGSAVLALLCLFPGSYYVAFSAPAPHYYAAWAFANGMESGLSVLAFGALVWWSTRRRLFAPAANRADLLLAGLFATLVVLARLDDVFLLPAFALSLRLAGAPWRSAVWFTAVPTLAIGAYLLVNYAYSGMFFPVSGMAKGGLGVATNLKYALAAFLPAALEPRYGASAATDWRVFAMVIPAAAGAGYFAWIARRRASFPLSFPTGLVAALALFLTLKGAYNFLFVALWHQGHWYYVTSMLALNVLAAVGPGNLLIRLPEGPRRGTLALLCAGAVAFGAVFLAAKTSSAYNQHYYRFFRNRVAVAGALQPLAGAGILEFDDGIVGFSLPFPAMSGLGFALDKEAYERMKAGHLLDVAYERGFKLFGSLNYFRYDGRLGDEIPHDRLAGVFFLAGQNISAWRFRVAYIDAPTGATFVAFEPR